jgi:hypothetical protein
MRSLTTCLATVSLLACSGCRKAPADSTNVPPAQQQQTNQTDLPDWVTTLIGQQPPRSSTVIEESSYQGHRAFLVMPSDRCCDTGNEHVLHSEDGRIICEFGGFAGHVTVGSCDIDGIKYVRTLFPQTPPATGGKPTLGAHGIRMMPSSSCG